MSLKFVGQPQFRIELKGFEGLVYTESSKTSLDWLGAAKFVAEHNAVLQSLPEAVAFRIDARDGTHTGFDHSNEAQLTRTSEVFFVKNGQAYIAFDDIPDPAQNILIARAQEMNDARKEHKEFLVSLEDRLVSNLLMRAEKASRITKLPSYNGELDMSYLHPEQYKWDSGVLRAVFGDIAKPYFEHLHYAHQCDYLGYFWLGYPEHVYEAAGDKLAIVKPVGLATLSHIISNNKHCFIFDADSHALHNGYARGVCGVHEKSMK
jgi:hypothetical protein